MHIIKLSLLLIACGIMIDAKAQKIITILPNGEVKTYSNDELKQQKDRSTDGYRVMYSDSGVVIEEADIKEGDINGYRKIYKNGILVALGFYEGACWQEHICQ